MSALCWIKQNYKGPHQEHKKSYIFKARRSLELPNDLESSSENLTGHMGKNAMISSNYCHTRLHLGFSARLRLWQVPTCKMEPQRGFISWKKHPATHPTVWIFLFILPYTPIWNVWYPPRLILKHLISSVVNLYLQVWHFQLSLFCHIIMRMVTSISKIYCLKYTDPNLFLGLYIRQACKDVNVRCEASSDVVIGNTMW